MTGENGIEASLGSITIDEGNILVKLNVEDRVEVIRALGDRLFQNGYVKDTYIQAVLDREVVFPTGLQTSQIGMAIPHTDAEHVNRAAIAIATLARPVIFQGMGMPDTSVPVTLVMMLAIDNPKSVMIVLRSVLFILENAEALEQLDRAGSTAEVKQIMEAHIASVAQKLMAEESGDISH